MVLFVWRYIIPNPSDYFGNHPYYSCEKIIDYATSVIWCERYYESGSFHITIPATPELLQYFSNGEFIFTRNDTKRAMVLERIELTTSAENGDYMKISGRSAEGIMRQRVIMQKETKSDNVAKIISDYIDDNIGNYWYYNSDSDIHSHINNPRGVLYINLINNLPYDSRINSTAVVQPYGENLGGFIETMCKSYDFGFKAEFDDGEIFCKCFVGDDRSLDQSEFPSVVFSEDFGNLGETSYTSDKNYNIYSVLVGGEGEGKDRKEYFTNMFFRNITGQGLYVRQKFVDAHSLSSNEDGITNYNALLASTAYDTINSSLRNAMSFDVEALSGGQFQYRKDYFLGDTVSVRNAYGITGKAKVIGTDESEDDSGYKLIPYFSELEV